METVQRVRMRTETAQPRRVRGGRNELVTVQSRHRVSDLSIHLNAEFLSPSPLRLLHLPLLHPLYLPFLPSRSLTAQRARIPLDKCPSLLHILRRVILLPRERAAVSRCSPTLLSLHKSMVDRGSPDWILPSSSVRLRMRFRERMRMDSERWMVKR